MNKFAKGFFAGFGLNGLIVALNFAVDGIAILLLFTVPIEIFVGLLLLFFRQHRELGGGLLLSSLVSFLTAGFVCSNVSFR